MGNAYVSLDTGLVNNLVDVIGRHTRLRGGGSNVEDLSCKRAALSHSILSSLVENFDLVAAAEGAAVLGVAILPPHGVRNRFGEGSMRGERIDGSQRAGVGEVGERVVVAGSWIW